MLVRALGSPSKGLRCDFVLPAPLTLVSGAEVLARLVGLPGTNAVHRLGAVVGGALLVPMWERAGIPIVLRALEDGHVGALLALALADLAIAEPEVLSVRSSKGLWLAEPSKDAVRWLGAALLAAVSLSVLVLALSPAVGSRDGDLVLPAPLVEVSVLIIEALLGLLPVPDAINGLWAALVGALGVPAWVWALLAVVVGHGGHVELPAHLILARRGVEGTGSV